MNDPIPSENDLARWRQTCQEAEIVTRPYLDDPEFVAFWHRFSDWMFPDTSMTAYRVGLGRDLLMARQAITDRDWRRARYQAKVAIRSMRRRSWWGLWQAEWTGCEHAVRGLTRRHCERRAAIAHEAWLIGQCDAPER